MNSKVNRGVKLLLASAVASACVLTSSGGAKIYISSSGVSHAGSGGEDYSWNACSLHNGGAPGVFKSLKDSEGNATDVSMLLMSPANGAHARAVGELAGDAAEFEAIKEATESLATYHISPEKASTVHEPEIRARFTGLDPDRLYEFSFLAFATGGTDLSEKYTVIGATTAVRVFNPAGNTTKVVRIPAMAPLPDGSVEFTLSATESNAHENRAAYISAIKIEETDSLPGQDIYIDAYDAGVEDRSADGMHWNAKNLYAAGVSMSKLVDSAGNTTSVGLVSTQGRTNTTGSNYWNMHLENVGDSPEGAAAVLYGDAAAFSGAVKGDTLYRQACLRVASDEFKATISGLYPECVYSFTFFASYCGTVENIKKVVYSVAGANSGSAVLNTDNNVSRVATISGIRPNEDGTVEISYRSTDDGAYSYLAAFRISRTAVAAPGTKPVFVKATPGGTVSATVGGVASSCERYLSPGQTLVATATPDGGYRFVGWTSSWINATETANPLSIPATQAVTWTAVFEKDEQYVSKTMYVDAYGTPSGDVKTWNTLGDAIFGYGLWQGPFLASDGTSAAVGLRTVCPFGTRPSDGAKPENRGATQTLTGDAAEFDAARGSRNNQLYLEVGLTGMDDRAIVSFDVCGLKPCRAYTFRFVASMINISNEPDDLFARCNGENVVSASLKTRNNLSGVAKAANVRPTKDGVVRVELSTAPQGAYARNYLVAHLMAFSVEGDISETDAKHVLWFGNSFSGNGDIPGRVADLAELAGFTRPLITKSLKNSSALAYHVDAVTNTPEANVEAPGIMYTTSRGWDDVVIQGRMLEAAARTAALNGYPSPSEGFIPLATNLYGLVRRSSKGGSARAVLFQTWPYGAGASDVYPSVYPAPEDMGAEIEANYNVVRGLVNGEWGSGSAVVAPAGIAYRNAKFAPDYYHGDLYHQGGKYGYELVSMVLFNRIYDVKVDERVTYEQARASGWTSLTEMEWIRLCRYAAGRLGMGVFVR